MGASLLLRFLSGRTIVREFCRKVRGIGGIAQGRRSGSWRSGARALPGLAMLRDTDIERTAMFEEATGESKNANERLAALEQSNPPVLLDQEASRLQVVDPPFHHGARGVRLHQLVRGRGAEPQAHHQRNRD